MNKAVAKKQTKKPVRRQAPAMIAGSWVGSLLAVGLVYLSARVAMADFGAFRSCDSNVGLSMESCGKHSLNFGDLLVLGFFVLSVCLLFALVNAAWRMTRGMEL